jgi:hypothetical protein
MSATPPSRSNYTQKNGYFSTGWQVRNSACGFGFGFIKGESGSWAIHKRWIKLNEKEVVNENRMGRE